MFAILNLSILAIYKRAHHTHSAKHIHAGTLKSNQLYSNLINKNFLLFDIQFYFSGMLSLLSFSASQKIVFPMSITNFMTVPLTTCGSLRFLFNPLK